jgi:hypothetical protein
MLFFSASGALLVPAEYGCSLCVTFPQGADLRNTSIHGTVAEVPGPLYWLFTLVSVFRNTSTALTGTAQTEMALTQQGVRSELWPRSYLSEILHDQSYRGRSIKRINMLRMVHSHISKIDQIPGSVVFWNLECMNTLTHAEQDVVRVSMIVDLE